MKIEIDHAKLDMVRALLRARIGEHQSALDLLTVLEKDPTNRVADKVLAELTIVGQEFPFDGLQIFPARHAAEQKRLEELAKSVQPKATQPTESKKPREILRVGHTLGDLLTSGARTESSLVGCRVWVLHDDSKYLVAGLVERVVQEHARNYRVSVVVQHHLMNPTLHITSNRLLTVTADMLCLRSSYDRREYILKECVLFKIVHEEELHNPHVSEVALSG